MERPQHLERRGSSTNLVVSGLTLAIAAGPVLYPAWLAARTMRRPDPTPPAVDHWPPLSVVVPAYREQQVIADKVADLLANGYPGALEVLVVADDPATADVARTTAARVIQGQTRRGKAAALNGGVAAATGDVVVVTDANTVLRAGSLGALVRWFGDSSTGAVAGEKQVVDRGEGLYWRYESWLKRREFRLGGTIGLVGELAAIRRSAWQPLPLDVVVDDLWIALDALEHGWRVAYEPNAMAVEAAAADWRETWERRTRVVAGTFDLLWRRKELLARPNLVAAQLWGHKLLRQSIGPVSHAIAVAIALRRSRQSIAAAGVVAGHVAGSAALFGLLRQRAVPGVAAVGGEILFLHAVAVAGLVRFLRGDRPAVWSKPERVVALPDIPAGLDSAKRLGGAEE